MRIDQVELFGGLSPEFLRAVDEVAVVERHPPGTILFRQGEQAESLFLLAEGRIRLSTGDRGHVAEIMARAGDPLGWSSLVERGSYSASAECLSPTVVLRIAAARLDELFERDPRSGMIFYRRLAGLIGNRLVQTYRLLPTAHEKGATSQG